MAVVDVDSTPLAFDDVGLAQSDRAFRSARTTGAHSGSRLRPVLALLGAGLVLGAASALALRWVPTLIDAAQPIAAVAAHIATPTAPAPGEPRTVQINSQPSGAHVLLEGEKIGTTPLQLQVHGDTKISVARKGYVRQLVSVPYDSRSPLLIKLTAQPTDKTRPRERASDEQPFLLSLKQETLPRIGPRADLDHERRDPGPNPTEPPRSDSDREQRARASEARAAPAETTDTDAARLAATDSRAARAETADARAQHAVATDSRVVASDASAARVEGTERGALHAREVIEQVEPEPGVVRLRKPPGNARGLIATHQAEEAPSSGLDVARVLEMGREHDGERQVAGAARSLERERAAEIVSEHRDFATGRRERAAADSNEHRRQEMPPPAAETSHSAATSVEAIREDELAEIALDDDERAHVAQHYGLRELGRAMVRAVGKLLIPYPNRARRAVLAQMPLAYSSFREARAAYKQGEVDATGFQEAVWQLRERRRQKIWVERDRYARGQLSQNQYEAKVDRIWDEFWGQR